MPNLPYGHPDQIDAEEMRRGAEAAEILWDALAPLVEWRRSRVVPVVRGRFRLDGVDALTTGHAAMALARPLPEVPSAILRIGSERPGSKRGHLRYRMWVDLVFEVAAPRRLVCDTKRALGRALAACLAADRLGYVPQTDCEAPLGEEDCGWSASVRLGEDTYRAVSHRDSRHAIAIALAVPLIRGLYGLRARPATLCVREVRPVAEDRVAAALPGLR